MTFAPVAASLREAVIEHYRERGEPVGRLTLETNSVLVERRGLPIVGLVCERLGVRTLDGLRVADLGCGFGALALLFAAWGAEVHGIDANGPRLRVGRSVAARHGLDARFARGRLEAPSLDPNVFDAAVLNNSLCYIVEPADRARALGATFELLRPGGAIALRNPNRWHPLDQFTRLPLLPLLPPEVAERRAAALGRVRSRVRLLSPPAARRELSDAGFADVRHTGPGRRRTKLVARYQHLTARRP